MIERVKLKLLFSQEKMFLSERGINGSRVKQSEFPRSYNVRTENKKHVRRNSYHLKHTLIKFNESLYQSCEDDFDDFLENKTICVQNDINVLPSSPSTFSVNVTNSNSSVFVFDVNPNDLSNSTFDSLHHDSLLNKTIIQNHSSSSEDSYQSVENTPSKSNAQLDHDHPTRLQNLVG